MILIKKLKWSTIFVIGLIAIGLASNPSARAKEPTLAAPLPRPSEPPIPAFSLTISPIHLTLPVVELTGEFRLHDQLGIAAIAGVGSVKSEGVRLSVFEIGTSVRYYALGDFRHGMQVGLEGLYVHVSGRADNVSAAGHGLGLGPFLGYKFAARSGLTFDSQIGVQRVGIGLSASTGENTTDSGWAVLLNLNLGYSF